MEPGKRSTNSGRCNTEVLHRKSEGNPERPGIYTGKDLAADMAQPGKDIIEKIGKSGPRSLSDRELMMILLSSENGKTSEEVLSLIDRGKSFPLSSLINIPGVGKERGAVILAALELGRRKNTRKNRSLVHAEAVYQEIRHFADRERENLIVISLNGAMEIISVSVVTVGLVDRTLIHPREVFTEPIRHLASAIIIAHNHPSGNLRPSAMDISETKRLMEAGDLLGIRMLDHLIFSSGGFYSMKGEGDMEKIRFRREAGFSPEKSGTE